MTPFPEFQRLHGPAVDPVPADSATVQQYADRLPRPLIDLWLDAGWCGYAEGLVWLTDPAFLEDVLEDLFRNPAVFTVFGHTAFADLLLWGRGAVHYLDVQYADLTKLTPDISRFLEVALCTDDYLDAVLHRRRFREALPRLGRPAADECYALEPVLALGGSGDVETLRRVKLREHLALLARIHARA